MYNTFVPRVVLFLILILVAGGVQAAGTLNIYWTDMEGGAGTLMVTPAGQSILIDTGNPSRPNQTNTSAERIHAAAVAAGVTKIDYLIITHFHIDHFGGAAELAKLMPIGEILDNGIPDHDPDGGTNSTRFLRSIQPDREMQTERRVIVMPGQDVALQQAPDSAPISLHCVGARQQFPNPDHAPVNPLCENPGEQRPVDTSDNINSIVMLLKFGPFKLYLGGDLTWNMERSVVCPNNLVGTVDIYQVDHHGLDLSNNPLLVRSLSPTVSVMSNGPHKGANAEVLATLRNVPTLQTMWQIHQNLQGGAKYNTDQQYIANLPAKCEASYIKCTVEPDGKSYTVGIPATGVSKTYATVLNRAY